MPAVKNADILSEHGMVGTLPSPHKCYYNAGIPNIPNIIAHQNLILKI